jgi:acetyl coenzyme A synthetase (ADP forming)-like protein
MKENIKYIFYPRSVAVIGASNTPGSVGHVTFANILLNGYTGVVYPVNFKATSVMGVKAYPSLVHIPDPVDLAVIIVPAPFVPEVIEECGNKGVKSAVIITAGFKEIGEKGKPLENRVKELAGNYGISLIGPNCFGVINTDKSVRFNATFGRAMPPEGNIAFISQSGAVGLAALEYAESEGIGLSKFASIGNKADLNENDLLEYLEHDDLTRVILLYIEDLVEPTKFLDNARRITEQVGKPILAIKAGRTAEGAKAASSHTGALAGSDTAYEAFFHQCGIIRAETVNELFEYAKAFSAQPIPKGRRIGIITNAGGIGIMATDSCIRNGLQLAQMSPAAREKFKSFLPATANTSNPVDVIGDADEKRYAAALKVLLDEPEVDGVIAIWTPTLMARTVAIAERVAEIGPQYQKPIMGCLLSLVNTKEVIQTLWKAKIPYYPFPEVAAKTLAMMSRFGEWMKKPVTEVKAFADVDRSKVNEVIAKAKSRMPNAILEPEGYSILAAYKLPVLPYALVKDAGEAVKWADMNGYPVVLKIVSQDILHKTEVGGVMVDIENEQELKTKFKDLMDRVREKKPDARIEGVLVQPMARSGVETIIGIKRDPQFGPLIMFGIGGIYVEIFKDVSFRICPIRELSAEHMVSEIKGYKILQGFRGKGPADTDRIVESLERLSQLAIDFPCFSEIDVNPFVVYEKGQGACAIDARFLYSEVA